MAGIKDRLIQFVLRGRDELSPAAEQGADALEALRREGERLGSALDQAKAARSLSNSLAAAGRAADQARSGLERAEQRAAALRAALDKDPDSKGLATALQEAEREAARATRELNRATTQLGDLEQAAKAAGIDTDRLADEQQRLAQAVGDSRQALDQHTQQLRELERQEAAAARGAAEHASRLAAVREALDGATRRVLAFTGAFVGVDAAVSVVDRLAGAIRTGIVDMLKTGDQMEGLELRINSLMGSMESGEKAIAWIRDFTKTAPMTIAEVTDAFALLKGFGLDPMDGSLQALVDKNAQLGGEMDRLQGIVIALGQAWGKEKLQAEEITQLVERGIPAWQLLSQATGKTVAQLQELSSEGRLGRDVIAALIAELGKSAEGQALSAMSRLSGQLSQLKNTAQDFYDRIAKAGALDYVKGKLDELLATIREMDSDGRLDRLAKSLSTAFIDGARQVEEFGRKLLGTDFKTLSDDSTKWLNDFGAKLDQTTTSVQLFVAPFRTLFNGITSGFLVAALAATSFGDLLLGHLGRVANFVPDMLGGDKLRAGIAEARDALNGLTEGFAAQIEQDGKDIAAAWEVASRSVAGSAAEQTAAVKSAREQQRMLDQAYADELIANQKKAKDAAVAAAAEGTAAIGNMAEALKLIDAASTTAQIDGLRDALREAYQSGAISQQDYARASGVLNEKLRQLQRGAGATAGEFAGLEDKFASLESIMGQIGRAANEVDFSQIRAGLRKAYGDGTISAEDFARAQTALAERMDAVKKAAAATGRSVKKASGEMADASAETEGSLRRLGGAAEDAGAGVDFFGSILSQAREPLAGMSDAALKAFDALQGINNTDWGIDTGNLEATEASLRGAQEQLAFLKTELAKPLPHTNAGIWAMETLIRSHELQVSYLGQKKALQSLMEGYEDGSISLEAFIRRAERAQRGLSLLDSADLASLKIALESARQQMDALGDSSRNTLDSLQSELAQLRGDQDEVDRRAFANRRRELEAQRAEAQAAGNGQAVEDLSRAIATLREIEAETANRRLREQQQAQAQAQQQVAEPAPTTTQPTTVIRLESPRGRRVDVQVPAGQQTQLLDILADAGLRTL
ncbi:tape measure protein [Azotobacter chroococcum]|uniref:tape measure protein n=1 Tax=Azotobacter chroococcum TaxID=353 RepID=UPI0010AE3BE9|nr:tape measure protein [Azotobacter chroococcum]TKD46044.1 tape measure domain-containing protein [Azotobacter chroococcum]